MNSMGEHSPFFIQRNKFTLSIRTVKSGSVSHFPFSILNFVLLCCNIYSFLLCSGLLYCTVLCSTVLFSALCTFSPRNAHFSPKNSDFSPRNPERWKNTPDSTNY